MIKNISLEILEWCSSNMATCTSQKKQNDPHCAIAMKTLSAPVSLSKAKYLHLQPSMLDRGPLTEYEAASDFHQLFTSTSVTVTEFLDLPFWFYCKLKRLQPKNIQIQRKIIYIPNRTLQIQKSMVSKFPS